MKGKIFFSIIALLIVIPIIVPDAIINEIELYECSKCGDKKLVKIRTFEFWVLIQPLKHAKEITYSADEENIHEWMGPVRSWITGSNTVDVNYRYYFLAAALLLLFYRYIIKNIVLNRDFLAYFLKNIKAFKIFVVLCGVMIMSYIFISMIADILSELPKSIAISPVINLKGNIENMNDTGNSSGRHSLRKKNHEDDESPLNIGGFDVQKMIKNIDDRNKNIKDLDLFKNND